MPRNDNRSKGEKDAYHEGKRDVTHQRRRMNAERASDIRAHGTEYERHRAAISAPRPACTRRA
jgi:hypothetical protein